jgi:hypothetical protein
MKKRSYILTEVFQASGNAAKLAQHLGISRAAVCNWKQVPIKHLRTIVQFTGLPRERLRPDLYDDFPA